MSGYERMVTRATSAAAVFAITLEYYFHCGIQWLHAEIICTKTRSVVAIFVNERF